MGRYKAGHESTQAASNNAHRHVRARLAHNARRMAQGEGMSNLKRRTDILLLICVLIALFSIASTLIQQARIQDLKITFTKEIERLNRNHNAIVKIFSAHIIKLEKNQFDCHWMETRKGSKWADELTKELEGRRQ